METTITSTTPWARDLLTACPYALHALQRAQDAAAQRRATAYGLGSPGAPREGSSGPALTPTLERNVVAMLDAADAADATATWALGVLQDARDAIAGAEHAIIRDASLTGSQRAHALESLDAARMRYVDDQKEGTVAAALVCDRRTVRRRIAYAIALLDSRTLGAWRAASREFSTQHG